MIGISNEPLAVIEDFIEDQGISFPVLRDDAGVYSQFNIPGSQSPFPRDYIMDAEGIIRLAKTEYDPGAMINIIEGLLDETVSSEIDFPLPNGIKLLSNYPNPFNPSTTIQFDIGFTDVVTLDIIDSMGRIIQTLIREKQIKKGKHQILFPGLDSQGKPISSGVYLVQLNAGKHFVTQKIVLMK